MEDPKLDKSKAPSLDESVLDYVGEALFVSCCYGWGWVGNANAPDAPDAPKHLKITLTRIWDGDVLRRGGIGKVITTEHEFHDWWVLFDIRHEGTFNFEDKIGHYNIEIGENEPKIAQNGWPNFPVALNSIGGYGSIAKTEALIQEYETREQEHAKMEDEENFFGDNVKYIFMLIFLLPLFILGGLITKTYCCITRKKLS